jgi:hypothetical protein
MNWPGFNPRQVHVVFLVKVMLQGQVFCNISNFHVALLFDQSPVVKVCSFGTDDI